MEQDALQALPREAAEKTVGGVPQSQARRPRLAECAMLYLEWPTPGRFASPRFAVSRLFSCEPRRRRPDPASQNVPFAKSAGSWGLQPGVAREGEKEQRQHLRSKALDVEQHLNTLKSGRHAFK
jgi:hypothetical protein